MGIFMYYIVGLGNPGEEYEMTRHNAGRAAALDFAKKTGAEKLKYDKKLNALVSEGKMGKEKFQVILPETFMNKSGHTVKNMAMLPKNAKNFVVLHDDIDLPLGSFKISFGKNSAGHKGVESVIKAVKTKDFIRIRIGVSAVGAKGIVKKPSGEKFLDFIVGKFKPAELKLIKKVSKEISFALETIFKDGIAKAMSEYN